MWGARRPSSPLKAFTMTDLLPLLHELCDVFGPSGHEDEVRACIRRHIEPLVDEVEETILGNLIVRRRGVNPRATILLDAHMDEVGLMITGIDDQGFLRFGPLGGWDARVMPAHRVVVRAADGSKRTGIIGVLPPHVTAPSDRDKAYPMENLVIDIGCSSASEAADLGICVGSPALIQCSFAEMANGIVSAKALDDRVGCAIVISVFKALKDKPLNVDLIGSFSVQEETGGTGAMTTAATLQPEVALIIEGTTATDTPGVPASKRVASIGQGPAITIADARTIVPEKLVRFLEKQAIGNNIPYQFKTPLVGGTDAHSFQSSGRGILTGIVSVPCRYIHSPVSLLSQKDMADTAKLVKAVVANIGHDLFPK